MVYCSSVLHLQFLYTEWVVDSNTEVRDVIFRWSRLALLNLKGTSTYCPFGSHISTGCQGPALSFNQCSPLLDQGQWWQPTGLNFTI